MKRVYVLVEEYTYDFERELNINVYETKQKAAEQFEAVVARERRDTWIATKCGVKQSLNKTKLSYNAYVDGCAIEFETKIYVRVEIVK